MVLLQGCGKVSVRRQMGAGPLTGNSARGLAKATLIILLFYKAILSAINAAGIFSSPVLYFDCEKYEIDRKWEWR